MFLKVASSVELGQNNVPTRLLRSMCFERSMSTRKQSLKEGLDAIFGLDLGTASMPGHTGQGAASAGRPVIGRHMLLNHLETGCGLGVPEVSGAEPTSTPPFARTTFCEATFSGSVVNSTWSSPIGRASGRSRASAFVAIPNRRFQGTTVNPMWPRTCVGIDALPGCHLKPTHPQKSPFEIHRLKPGKRVRLEPSGRRIGAPPAARSSKPATNASGP